MAIEAEKGGSLFLLVQGGRLRRRLTPVLDMGDNMVFRTRKAASIAGILLVAIGWVIKAPTLVRWADTGLISVISALLLLAATVSLLVGTLKIQLGKRGRLPFVMHIVFAILALLSLHFLFWVPLAIGIFVAGIEIFWPVKSLTVVNTTTDAGFI